MVMPPYKRIHGSREQVFAQRSGEDAIRDLIANAEILDGVHIKSVSLANGDTTIAHKLERLPRGWIITDISAAANVYRSSWSQTALVLNSSAACTANVWVF